MKKILLAGLISACFVSCKKSSQSPTPSSNTPTGKYAEYKKIDTVYQANGSSAIVNEPFLADTLNFTSATGGIESGPRTATFTYSIPSHSLNDGNQWLFFVVNSITVEVYYKGNIAGSGGVNEGMYYQEVN